MIVEYFKKKDGMIFKPQKKSIIVSKKKTQKFHTTEMTCYTIIICFTVTDSIPVSRLFYELIVSYLSSSLKRSSYMKIFSVYEIESFG